MHKRIQAFIHFLLLMGMLSILIACKSDKQRLEETLAAASRSLAEPQQPSSAEPAPSDRQLDIQKSAFTNPVKHVPTQEELIREHHVRTVKEEYDEGFTLTTYDRKGFKIAEENDYLGKKTISYANSKSGKPTEIRTKFDDGTSMIRRIQYDEKDRPTLETTILSEGDTSIKEFVYDDVLNTRTEINSTGKEKEFYDNRGLRVRFESYDTEGKLVGSGEAEYDADGLKISEKATIMGIRAQDQFEYNARGQLVRMDRSGTTNVIMMFVYDEKGLMTLDSRSGLSTLRSTFSYTFY